MRTQLAGVCGKTFGLFTGRKAVLGLIGVCIALRDECVGIFDEYGIHVAGRVTARNFSPRNHHQVETGARASGLLVCAVAVLVRNVFDVGLPFEVLGDRDAVDAVAFGFPDADRGPHVTVREDRVRVEIHHNRVTALGVGKADLLAFSGTNVAVTMGSRRGDKSKRGQEAHGSLHRKALSLPRGPWPSKSVDVPTQPRP